MSGTDGIELSSKGGEQSQRLSGEISRTGKATFIEGARKGIIQDQEKEGLHINEH